MTTTPNASFEYEQAVILLKSNLTEWFPGAVVLSTMSEVPVFLSYNERDPHAGGTTVNASMIVVSNMERTSTLALAPNALYERGEIIASLSLLGTLATSLRDSVLEVLALRERDPQDGWVALSAHPLPTGRFSTMNLRETLAQVL
jgi:hypothetical protein